MRNYTHRRPLCGHCAPPLHERANPSAPFGLDFLDFHSKLSGHIFSRRAKQHELCSCPFLATAHQRGTLYICPHALHERANPSAPSGLDFLDFHSKLSGHMFSHRAKQHALCSCPVPATAHQRGTLYICPHALHERANQSAPSGLDFLDFHSKLIAEMDLLTFYRRLILLFREYYKGILFLAGNFLQII